MPVKLSWLVPIGLVLGITFGWINPLPGQARTLNGGLNGHPGKSSPAGLTSPLTASPPACFSWDFQNAIGLDATGLVIHLHGISSFTRVYTGALNPFGAPDQASGYNSTSGVYSLIFTGGPQNLVAASDMAQIGLCANTQSLRVDTTQPAFYWVVAGSPAAPAPLFAGLDFIWVGPNHLQVHLYNEQSTPLTAYSLTVSTPSGPLSLDDLNPEVIQTLPLAADAIADPLDLAGGAATIFDIYFSQGGLAIPGGAPVVIAAALTAQDDPGNTLHVFAQTAQPFFQAYLPLIR